MPALALVLAACDTSGVDGPGVPLPDEIVEGVNLTELFAAPTSTERDAVRAEWATRDAERDERYDYVTLPPVRAADGSDLIVYVGHAGAGGTVVHHGVVRLPPRLPGDVAPRPVVLVLPADSAGATVAGALATLPVERSLIDDFIHVVSSFRGQTLTVEGTPFTSPTDSSAAYDLDAEDALALLDEVLDTEPLADPGRVAISGYDRGGTAALIAGERMPGLRMVTSLAAPTDFFLPDMRHLARAYLRGESTGAFPAFADVAVSVLEPLRGGGGNIDAARMALLRRSPAHFAGPPPFIYAAHGFLDAVVPVSHGRALIDVIGTPEAVYSEHAEEDHPSLPRSQAVIATVTALFIEKVRDP